MSSTSSSSSDSDSEFHGRRPYMRRVQRRRYLNIQKLVQDFQNDDETFSRDFGITQSQFQTIYAFLSSHVNRSPPTLQKIQNIKGKDRLALCLRFMATGKSFHEIGHAYCLQPGVMQIIVKAVCNAIIQKLRPVVMPRPNRQSWERIAASFRSFYDMPNCLGSLNGRHITVINNKQYILLSLVDANQRFIMINVCESNINPHKIWSRSAMSRKFKTNEFNMPNNRPPVENYPSLPFVIVGGNSFPSKKHLITKYRQEECAGNDAKAVYNFRINPVKEATEQAVTRLRRRWQIIQSPFPVPAKVAERIIMAACCLENYFGDPI